MDYTRFRFRAVVDWIEIEIQTKTPTNFQTVRRSGSLHYALPMNKGEGGTGTLFRFRIQDPKNWLQVLETCKCITAKLPIEGSPKVVGIEIALDAYSRVRIPPNLDTDSSANWTVIPRQTGQPFQGNLDSRSVATRGL